MPLKCNLSEQNEKFKRVQSLVFPKEVKIQDKGSRLLKVIFALESQIRKLLLQQNGIYFFSETLFSIMLGWRRQTGTVSQVN